MRLSLMKVARAALAGAAYRKSGYLAFFARYGAPQIWISLLNALPRLEEKSQKLRGEFCGIPHLAKNERDMGHPSSWQGEFLKSYF